MKLAAYGDDSPIHSPSFLVKVELVKLNPPCWIHKLASYIEKYIYNYKYLICNYKYLIYIYYKNGKASHPD